MLHRPAGVKRHLIRLGRHIQLLGSPSPFSRKRERGPEHNAQIPPLPTQYWLFLIATLLFNSMPDWVGAKTLIEKYERLTGVTRFELDIVPLSDEAKSLGLSREDLRFLIEANLKRAGLPLQKKSSQVVPYLLADVKVACSQESPACSYVLVLRFDDVVQLRGNTTYAQTWEWNLVGVAEPKDVAVSVLAALRDRGMPNFVLDYLKANP